MPLLSYERKFNVLQFMFLVLKAYELFTYSQLFAFTNKKVINYRYYII